LVCWWFEDDAGKEEINKYYTFTLHKSTLQKDIVIKWGKRKWCKDMAHCIFVGKTSK